MKRRELELLVVALAEAYDSLEQLRLTDTPADEVAMIAARLHRRCLMWRERVGLVRLSLLASRGRRS